MEPVIEFIQDPLQQLVFIYGPKIISEALIKACKDLQYSKSNQYVCIFNKYLELSSVYFYKIHQIAK